uniref:Uncharacterized protein n=1 Tax=Romanomermis culicivorax TaxID=13658 RepID=A0A915KQP2_ROMCU
EELQRYIASVLHFPALRNHKETVQFLDVSRLSFVYNLEHKWKEGLIVKKPGGHFGFKSINFNNCKKSCAETCHCKEWYHRELLIQCKTEFEAISWKDNIDKAVSANLGAEWRIYHPFGSSYPQRENSYAHW